MIPFSKPAPRYFAMKTPWKPANPSALYILVLLLFFVPVLFLLKERDMKEVSEQPILPSESEMPDFTAIVDIELKKQVFFDYFEPFIDVVNARIIEDRERILAIRNKVALGNRLTSGDRRYLESLAERYELEADNLRSEEFLNVLLRRVDKIPASLALAQAANESAWGTSRFAQDGNNLFGQWCYSDGCGIVPSRRRQGASHEVKSFDSVLESVEAYIHNLNTFPSYQMLRRIRQQLRQQNRPVDGISLADGLESYSSRGLDYIEELQNMIYSNNLLARDKPAL